ncbi:putative metalloprotease CJM1_0395 family protein [Helicobacter burdigaliensis]|uniref:putative metalloprotease CJM1_0395 family protein n=1 Tax=Helicobacter burdigaliensis TaxID=2315334 RepID=UPI000EF69AF0|nr:putative metalloprotease CJM1_0395 family protein [Helicobacter burdigaliensis]
MQISNSFNLQDFYQNQTPNTQNNKETSKEESTTQKEEKENTTTLNGKELEPSQVQYVRKLEQIDRNVKAHEAAHVAAGAGVTRGGASYTYTKGPDGKMYATAGEVPIALEKGDTPEQTIQNARQVIAAAMAPSDPSPQDYKVAASAAQMEIQARAELAKENAKENAEEKKEETSKNDKSQEKQQKDWQDTQEKNKRDYAIRSYTSKENIETFKIAG